MSPRIFKKRNRTFMSPSRGIPSRRRLTFHTLIILIIIVAVIGAGAYLFLSKGEGVQKGGQKGEGEQAPAEFKVSNLTVSSSQAEPGESVTISMEVSNIGEEEGTYTVELTLDGVVEETENVTLGGGESTTVSFTIQKQIKKSYSVEIGDLSQSFEVVEPAKFELSNLSVDPREAVVGERVKVSVDVRNEGEIEGTYKAKLRFSWGVDDTSEVTLEPGQSTTVTFSFTVNEPGTYHPRIGDLRGIFEILGPIEIIEEKRFDALQGTVNEPTTWIEGIMKNNSGNNLVPQIQVNYYNNGTLIYKSTDLFNWARIPIGPGKKYSFRTEEVWHQGGVGITDYEIITSAYNADLEPLSNVYIVDRQVVSDIAPAESEKWGEFGDYTVRVTVRNESKKIARIYCGGSFYSDGEFVGANDQTAQYFTLPPGGETETRVNINYRTPKKHITDYKLYMSSWVEE